MNEAINPPARHLGRTIVSAPGVSVTIAAQAAPAGAETHQYRYRSRTAEATYYSQQGCTATERFVHGRLRDDLASPLPRPSDAPSHLQLAALAS